MSTNQAPQNDESRNVARIDWSKAPENATHAVSDGTRIDFVWAEFPKGGGHAVFHAAHDTDGTSTDYFMARPSGWKIVSCRDTYPAQHSVPYWSGEGLPPVGVACQVTPHNDVWGFSTLETRPCSVIAYHADFAWIDLGGPGVPVATRIDKVDFTPIRTPEQIASDERLHKIRNACTDIAEKVEPWNNDIDCSQAMRATIEAMIDAGYRKP